MKASHQRKTVLVGYQEVQLEPGDFVFGRRKAAAALSLSERTIRTCLNTLKKSKRVTTKTTSKFSIISIIKWADYQQDECTSDQQGDQQSDQQATSKRPASDQQATTNKNVKNEKNEKNVDRAPKKAKQIPTDFKINEPMNAWFEKQNFLKIDINRETEKFVDHWKSNGSTKKDWVAAWRNWMRNAEDWCKAPADRSKEGWL